MDITVSAIADILQERKRQDSKWGEQNHSLPVWLTILAEEFGEASKEINEFHFRDHGLDRLYRMREELIQTAAVATAMAEYIDRHTLSELLTNEGK